MKGLIAKRKALGLTQKAAADKLGLTFRTYCNYEYGNREPNIETLKRMARFFDCSIDELI